VAPPRTAIGAAAISGGALVLAYLLTLAPTVTLWDSGEFLAAAATLGVPHPPGTPLFVVALSAWGTITGPVPLALASNIATALAAATAAGGMAWLVARWTRVPLAGVAAALVGGTTATWWQSATETEVYAHAALLVVLTLVAAEWAGSRWSARHRLLVAFAFGLAVPLHISALVGGPAIILLAASDASGTVSVRAALPTAAAWCLAVGLGTVSLPPLLLAVVLALVATVAPPGDAQGRQGVARWEPVAALLLAAVGASVVLVMLVRAQHDPGLNEGNPASWQALVDVIARRQFDVPPIWPRRAPAWLQVGNLVQYADWQVAAGVDGRPGASPWRTPATLAFVLLAVVGARWHRARDRRGWRIMALLLACASLGVVTVLNLRAGPSFGWGVLPDGALREARERDYFFALAFALAGAWSGCGIVAIAQQLRERWRRPVLALAVLPLLLNWRAVDRRRLPDATLAPSIARALLNELPPDAILVLAGDNDTFPVWHAQFAERRRPDVTTVTVPLLGAGWYRAELQRRHALLGPTTAAAWQGRAATLGAIGDAAAAVGRPVLVAVSVAPDDRRSLRPTAAWRLRGMWYEPTAQATAAGRLLIDTSSVTRTGGPWSAAQRRLGLLDPVAARDPAGRYVANLLRCPVLAWQRVSGRDGGRGGLLESVCNFR